MRKLMFLLSFVFASVFALQATNSTSSVTTVSEDEDACIVCMIIGGETFCGVGETCSEALAALREAIK